MTTDTSDEGATNAVAQGRPVLVWVICALYVIGTVVAIPSIFALTAGAIRLSPAAVEFYESFGTLNYLGVVASAILGILAAVTLFQMRRSAFAYVSAAWFVGLIKTVVYWPNLRAMGRGLGYQGFTIAVGALIVFYVWRLWRTGRLVSAEQRIARKGSLG